MRHARFLSSIALSTLIVAACSTASAGWTYQPAPSLTPAPSSSGDAAPSASADLNVLVITAQNIMYVQKTVTAPAGTPFQIQFENEDAGTPHNVAIHAGQATGDEIFQGTVFNGIETRTYDVPALDAGTYAFVCTVHPTMVGTLTVE
jgi:plastocyanin